MASMSKSASTGGMLVLKRTTMRPDKSALSLAIDPVYLPPGKLLYKDKKPTQNFYHSKPYRSFSARLQRSRFTSISHGDLGSQQLYRGKTLVATRQDWPYTFRRYHMNDGLAIQDQGLIVVDAKDERHKTTHGIQRQSSGQVVFSFHDKQEAQLDAEDILRLLQDRPPRGKMRTWSTGALEDEFRRRWGRNGCWHSRKLEICVFLSCFEQTFFVFGDQSQYVRSYGQNLGKVKDNMDTVMVNLARVQNPRLMRFQRERLVNTKEIRGADRDGVPLHEFAVDHLPKYDVPHRCFYSEETEKFHLRTEPRVEEKIQAIPLGNVGLHRNAAAVLGNDLSGDEIHM